MEKDVYTAIVLQGGGALGAYECGVMKGLFESRPGFRPDVITGISIGAVNAAILAGAKDPIGDLEKVWHEFGELPHLTDFFEPAYQLIPRDIEQFLLRFGNQGMYRLRPEYVVNPFLAPFITNSYCDTSPLRNTLKEVVDLNRLNSYCQVVVSAVNVKSGQLEKFGNAESMRDGGKYDNEQGLSIDHILASASLPPAFPMTWLEDRTRVKDGNFYWDGGIHSNTPLSEAINCLERCEKRSRDVKREIIFVELFPMEGKLPENIWEVYSRFFNMIFASKLKLDEKLFEKYSSFIDLVENIDFLLGKIGEDVAIKQALDRKLASKDRGTVDAIRSNPGFENLNEHRRIDEFTRIQLKVPDKAGPGFGNPLDFSKESIKDRIDAGQEAVGDFLRKAPVRETTPVREIEKKAA